MAPNDLTVGTCLMLLLAGAVYILGALSAPLVAGLSGIASPDDPPYHWRLADGDMPSNRWINIKQQAS